MKSQTPFFFLEKIFQNVVCWNLDPAFWALMLINLGKIFRWHINFFFLFSQKTGFVYVCVAVLCPSQPIRVISSVVSLPKYTFFYILCKFVSRKQVQIVSNRDNLHEMSKPVVWWKKKYIINLSSAELAQRAVKDKQSNRELSKLWALSKL